MRVLVAALLVACSPVPDGGDAASLPQRTLARPTIAPSPGRPAPPAPAQNGVAGVHVLAVALDGSWVAVRHDGSPPTLEVYDATATRLATLDTGDVTAWADHGDTLLWTSGDRLRAWWPARGDENPYQIAVGWGGGSQITVANDRTILVYDGTSYSYGRLGQVRTSLDGITSAKLVVDTGDVYGTVGSWPNVSAFHIPNGRPSVREQVCQDCAFESVDERGDWIVLEMHVAGTCQWRMTAMPIGDPPRNPVELEVVGCGACYVCASFFGPGARVEYTRGDCSSGDTETAIDLASGTQIGLCDGVDVGMYGDDDGNTWCRSYSDCGDNRIVAAGPAKALALWFAQPPDYCEPHPAPAHYTVSSSTATARDLPADAAEPMQFLDGNRLLYMRASTLVLLDLSATTAPGAPYADGVTSFGYSRAAKRLYFTDAAALHVATL